MTFGLLSCFLPKGRGGSLRGGELVNEFLGLFTGRVGSAAVQVMDLDDPGSEE